MTYERFAEITINETVFNDASGRAFIVKAIDKDDQTIMDEFGTWFHREDVSAK